MYASPSEADYRYTVFADTLEFIKTENQKDLTYELGINKFADLTWEEFKSKYLFAIEIDNPQILNNEETAKIEPVDHSKHVTPVKNQS